MKNFPSFEDFVNAKPDDIKVTTIIQTKNINESNIFESDMITPIKNSTSNDIDEKPTFVQWMQIGTASYLPSTYTVETLKPGVYTVQPSMQGTFAKKINLNTDDIIPLPNPIYKEIIENVSDFYKKEDEYKKAGYNHKRGILMYGRPGNGKSFIINHLIHHLVEKENVVAIYFPKYAEEFESFIYNLKEIEPKRKVMVIMEDLDGLMQMGTNKSAILNLLDGIKQINNICFIATTNYPERLEENIINRPSRFDKKYELMDPSEDDRRVYFKYKILDEFKDMYDIEKLVKDTEGLSMSHLKELLITLYVYKWDYNKCIEQLKNMSEIKQSTDNSNEMGNLAVKSCGCYESNFINLDGYEINEIDKNQLTYPELIK